ncbi:hypothetical protein BTVI_69706 [Pitangus sulphuratus]|nr:hypothetical protein BTVI_69706 [Pitangus sulphuratus]
MSALGKAMVIFEFEFVLGPYIRTDHVENPSRMTSSHADCHYCLQSLRGRKYALRDENAYCVACYDSLYANPCEECKQPIECNSKDLAYKGRHWHERCFKCAKCSRSLVEKPFAAKDEVLLCTECYSDEYSSKCFHCQKTIMPALGSAKYISFEDRQWHGECFNCAKCSVPLVSREFLTRQDDILCRECGSAS